MEGHALYGKMQNRRGSCHHSKLSLLLQPGSGNCWECTYHAIFQNAWAWSKFMFFCGVSWLFIMWKKRRESLPIHITNASLSNDISSSWNLASNHIQIGLRLRVMLWCQPSAPFISWCAFQVNARERIWFVFPMHKTCLNNKYFSINSFLACWFPNSVSHPLSLYFQVFIRTQNYLQESWFLNPDWVSTHTHLSLLSWRLIQVSTRGSKTGPTKLFCISDTSWQVKTVA